MKKRDKVKMKFDGRCAYSGTPLQDDWQVEHIVPKRNFLKGDKRVDHIDNLIPVQRILNHYKRALSLKSFRTWYLGELHIRLAKLPLHPRTSKSMRHKEYLYEVARLMGISETSPFNKIFYFETLKTN